MKSSMSRPSRILAASCCALVNDDARPCRVKGFEDFVHSTARLFSVRRPWPARPADLWSGEAAKKGLALSSSLRRSTPDLKLMGDAVRLRQVLDNLVSNAVKFTPKGQVEAIFSVREESLGWGLDAIVRDTGPGVPPESLEKIFAPFSTEAMDHDHGGAGMGLAIARTHLLMRMGRRYHRRRPIPGGGLCRPA